MTPLCTIGYEGFSSEEWLDSLVTNRIETVVDVREMLLSRKPGFSKTQLAESLRSRAIDYVHLKSLGNPKAYRDRLREGWDFSEFADEYRRILDNQPETLEKLHTLAVENRVCLVCFEEDPSSCHRSIVITVKTYPNPSAKYSETVCTAGVALDTYNFVCLYPVRKAAFHYESKQPVRFAAKAS